MRGLLIFTVAVAALAAVALPAVAYNDTPYDPVLSRHLLDLSGATYCHASQIAAWDCAFCKEEKGFTLTGTVFNSTTNMQTIVGYSAEADRVVLAFKGTSPTSIINWLADLDASFLDEDCPECAVHKGFYQTYLSVRDQSVELLKKAIARWPGKLIAITGHSLGGALTNVAAVDLQVTEGILANDVYSYGQPRVGNPAFADYYRTKYAGETSYRVTHNADPVPHVPMQSMGYQHHASEVYYDEFNLNWKTCDGSGEDPSCSSQHILINALDHGTYLSADFMLRFTECLLFTQKHENNATLAVRDPLASSKHSEIALA